MKINQELRVGIDNIRKEQYSTTHSSERFGQLVVKQGEKIQHDQLTKLLGDISTAGDKIARSRNLRDLAKFKMLIKKFLKEAVGSGIGLKQSHTWNRFGEGRRLKIVETIDEQLIELAEELLNEEKSSIDILNRIGEIKGLLINLYT